MPKEELEEPSESAGWPVESAGRLGPLAGPSRIRNVGFVPAATNSPAGM